MELTKALRSSFWISEALGMAVFTFSSTSRIEVVIMKKNINM